MLSRTTYSLEIPTDSKLFTVKSFSILNTKQCALLIKEPRITKRKYLHFMKIKTKKWYYFVTNDHSFIFVETLAERSA
jgi:hypothetical protein